MADKKEIDEVSGVETTGHEWDGIKELNNPLPRWWLWTFYACIIWAIGYMIAYPAIPLINGATKGMLGYSSRAEVVCRTGRSQGGAGSVCSRRSPRRPSRRSLGSRTAAVRHCRRVFAFKVNCAQCHGSGAQGGPGYPNLNDDDWIWGGTIDQIYTTMRTVSVTR
jgi:cytochrome c oxidase cbb3-type subunit 3